MNLGQRVRSSLARVVRVRRVVRSAALLAAALTLGAAPPRGSSSAAPTGSASTAALASLPTLSGAAIPTDASSVPKAAEWAAAVPVRVNRGDQGSCNAVLLREWLRLSCPKWIGGGLVAGDPKGVAITAFGDATAPENQALTTLVVPLRRGEATIVTFLQLGQEYNSAAYAEGGMLSITWRAGHADPMLVMTRLPEPSMFGAE
jgi:hypothetical protein